MFEAKRKQEVELTPPIKHDTFGPCKGPKFDET